MPTPPQTTKKYYIKVPAICLKLYAFPLLAKLAKWKGFCPTFMFQHGYPIQHKLAVEKSDQLKLTRNQGITTSSKKALQIHNYVTIDRSMY
jgi:hypothetical protein